MKPIIMPVAELKQALPGLAKVVGRKTTLPVLSAVKLARDAKGQVTIAATDLDTYVTYQAENNQPGTAFEAVLPLEPLNRLIKGSAGDLVITPDEKEVKVQYQVGSSPLEQKFNCLDTKEWPPSPKITKDAVVMPQGFGESLRQAFGCSSEDSTRFVLQGAYLDVSDKKCQSIISTNGRVLFSANSFHFDLKESVNIPKSKFLAWAGFLQDDCKLTIEPNPKGGGYVQLTTPRWNCITKQIEGNFPNWRQVVPRETATWTKVVLTNPALEQLRKVVPGLPGRDEENSPVRLTVNQALRVEGKNKDDKDYTGTVITEAIVSGKSITISLNREYLLHALSCGLNEIRIDDALSPLVFINQGRKMVVMPLRPDGPAPTEKPAPQPKPETPNNERTNMPRIAKAPTATTSTPAAETNNGHSSAKSLVDQVELIKESVKNVVRDLNSLIDAVKLAEKEQRASEKEVESARATLKKLQQVTI